MFDELRPAPFVLISTNHGSMIVNRNDYRMTGENRGYGVGYQLMTKSCFDPSEINFVMALLKLRKKHYGNGVVALDCGANLGVHSLEWARLMHDWGHVWSFEAQEKIYYALAGNIIINNCFNVTAKHAAVGATTGVLKIPEPDYFTPSSFGSFELKERAKNEFIGQKIDYSEATSDVALISIDSLNLNRIDLMKIDVEGMEEEVLEGAKESIKKYHPILVIEKIKSDQNALTTFLQNNQYKIFSFGLNFLAIHSEDKGVKSIIQNNNNLSISF